MDEVKNEDDYNDDVADRKLDYGTEDSCRHGVRVLPTDPPDVELRSAVDETLGVRDAYDQ